MNAAAGSAGATSVGSGRPTGRNGKQPVDLEVINQVGVAEIQDS